MKIKAPFFLLSLLGVLFALSVVAQKHTWLATPFAQNIQNRVYNMTPTEDGRIGFYLWVSKPSFESKMPIMKSEEYLDRDMNMNPLK